VAGWPDGVFVRILLRLFMIYEVGICVYSYYHFTPESLHRLCMNIGTKS